MLNKSISLFALMSFILVGCNKDEDIIINNPENPGVTTTLGYSVIEYTPAPGQYINESQSGFDKVTTMKEACTQAEIRLAENQYVSLGAWGGYIIIKFEKEITNSGGEYDLAIASNSFDSSNEPGIVWVMEDANNNGKPDETWYELKGSYFGQEGYERNLEVTYYRPEAGQDTYWTDSNGDEGFVKWMGSYHNQDFYYPEWVSSDSYKLVGSRLPSRAAQNQVTGIWQNLPFQWGYVDNDGDDKTTMLYNGKTLEVNRFRISDAVGSDGNPVDLKSIVFIKVQTAIMGQASILGENSTEVCGFFPLH